MKPITLLLIPLLLTACTSHIQTTSGKSYLERYQNTPANQEDTQPGDSNTGKSIEQLITKVASVEPVLKFPARIGLARIDQGQLSNIPDKEMEAWAKNRNNLSKGFGEFVPLNTMIAKMVTDSVTQRNSYQNYEVMNMIRLGAARQHLDAVLIYETYSRTDTQSNILSVANLTIIGGYILPSKAIEAEGFANAMLIDVVQGYPYGTAEVILKKESRHTSTWGSSGRANAFSEKVKTKAAVKLTKEVETMFNNLRLAPPSSQ